MNSPIDSIYRGWKSILSFDTCPSYEPPFIVDFFLCVPHIFLWFPHMFLHDFPIPPIFLWFPCVFPIFSYDFFWFLHETSISFTDDPVPISPPRNARDKEAQSVDAVEGVLDVEAPGMTFFFSHGDDEIYRG